MGIDIYQIVTDRIIDLLEAGTIPWRQPWAKGKAGFPRNLRTGRPYHGVNVFLLAVTAWQQGYESSYWLTFKQAKERGGTVRRGEASTLVIFWTQTEVQDKDTGETKQVPCLRYYRVFNVDQCEGIEAPDAPDYEPLDFQPIGAAQNIVDGYTDGPSITYGGSTAYYQPKTDRVVVPQAERFASEEAFYHVLFHELIHSTAHASRLDRQNSTPAAFGSSDYSKEELIAEMGAAFLATQACIDAAILENSAAYLQGWLKTLRGDKRLVITAAGAAQRASDWILGKSREP